MNGKKWKPNNNHERINFQQIQGSRKLNEFLSEYKGTTLSNYKTAFRKFFIWKKINPDEYLLSRNEFRKLKGDELYDYTDGIEQDISDFFHYEMEERFAPKTISCDKCAIKGLLKKHRIRLDEGFWDDLSKKLPSAKYSITQKETPTKEQLKSIFNNMRLVGKTLFMVQMTSFSRLDEILKLKLKDIELEHDFPRIQIRCYDNKKRKPIFRRISPEAKLLLNDYLKNRKTWIKNKSKKHIKNTNIIDEQVNKEDRLFPMSKQNAYTIWDNSLKKCGLYKKDNGRTTMGPHSLRRYAKQQFIEHYKADKNSSKNGEYWAKILMGKGKEYDTHDNKILDRHYSYGLNGLIVFEKTSNYNTLIEKLQEDMMLVNEKNDMLSRRLKSQTIEMQNIRQDLEESELENKMTMNQFLTIMIESMPFLNKKQTNTICKKLDEELEKFSAEHPKYIKE